MPTVFISYAHRNKDGTDLRPAALELCDRLRLSGVEAHLDQYLMSPPSSWPAWMFRSIRDADFVLVLGSDLYKERAEDEDLGAGTGAGWEGGIVSQLIYDDSRARGSRFIPAVLGGDRAAQIPYFLASTTIYDLLDEDDYRALLRHLFGVPTVVPPPVASPDWILTSADELDDASREDVPAVGAGQPVTLDKLVGIARDQGWSVRELAAHTRLQPPGGRPYFVARRSSTTATYVADLRRELGVD